MKRTPVTALLAAAVLAGCGGGGGSASDPASAVPKSGGLQEKVRAAQDPRPSDFPAPRGRSLQAVADAIGGGPTLALASSALDQGTNRLAFGVIDEQGQVVYGKTAVYVAPTASDRARGPYVAPADVLITEPRYRSKQAATAQDPFAAVYAAQVPFPRRGRWAVLAVTKPAGGKAVAAAGQVNVSSKAADPIPQVGQQAPRVATDTLADAKGDVSRIDTRQPPSDMHKHSFADVLGKKPVALLFSTPQLCQSRVCGPVTDIALEMEQRYGKRMEFIHQEVYEDNQPSKGLREPLRRFHLRTEPWLFVVNKQGRITARLEGSIGVRAFEKAIRSGL